MSSKGRTEPRVVCCAIPIWRPPGKIKIMIITSRKRKDLWVLPKGGFETSDENLGAAASREALEEAGVRGKITHRVTTIYTDATTYHFFEMEVDSIDETWLEKNERTRELVDFGEALRRVAWKPELAQGLSLSTLAPRKK